MDLFLENKALEKKATIADCALPPDCRLVCKRVEKKPTTPTVSITYRNATDYKKTLPLNPADTVTALMETYLKQIFGARFKPTMCNALGLFNGDVQLTGATLQDCHLPQGCSLVCKACQPATPVAARVSGEKLAVTITYMDAVKGKKDMMVDKSRTVAAVMEDYLAVEAISVL